MMEKIINYTNKEIVALAEKHDQLINNIRRLEKKKYLRSQINSNQSFKIILLSDFFMNEKVITKKGLTKVLSQCYLNKKMKLVVS